MYMYTLFTYYRSAYVTVMKICKIMLTTVLNAKLQVVIDACNADPQSPPNITQQEHSHAVLIQQALQFIPNPTSEIMTKNVAMRLGQHLTDQVSFVGSFVQTSLSFFQFRDFQVYGLCHTGIAVDLDLVSNS